MSVLYSTCLHSSFISFFYWWCPHLLFDSSHILIFTLKFNNMWALGRGVILPHFTSLFHVLGAPLASLLPPPTGSFSCGKGWLIWEFGKINWVCIIHPLAVSSLPSELKLLAEITFYILPLWGRICPRPGLCGAVW